MRWHLRHTFNMHLQLRPWHLKPQAVCRGHSVGMPYRDIKAALGPWSSLQGQVSWMLGREVTRPTVSKPLQKQELGKAKYTEEQQPPPKSRAPPPPGTATLTQRPGTSYPL